MSVDHLRKIISTENQGVLATIKRDGRPQLSVVNYAVDDTGVIRVSVTEDRAKARNLRRDPRASLHVATNGGRDWAVAQGTAELSAVAAEPHDEVVEELVAHYRSVWGEHPDWDDFRAAMVRDQRVMVRLRPDHHYGSPVRA